MILTPTLFVFITLLNEIASGTNIVEKENEKLDKNLKILRRDFNKLIENVEDFATDFLKQFQEASELVGAAYPNVEDYNWQDDKSKLNGQPAENNESSKPTSTEPPTIVPPKIYYSGQKTFPAKYIKQEELSNKINRIRRSNPNINPDNSQLMPVQQRLTLPVEESIASAPNPRSRPLNVVQPQNILGTQRNVKIDENNTNNNKNYKESQQTCATKTQREIEMEKQKLNDLKSEVKKLNELVALLKDQQKLIKDMSQNSMNLNTNEIDGDLIENSFLYKTLKRLQEDQKAVRQKAVQNDNMKVADTTYKLNSETENPGPTYREINELKLDLRETAANLNQTKEILMKGKEKEEILESELKRQNSELKFLKAMMENLYDKSSKLSESTGNDNKGVKVQNLRNSAFEDMDINSILGSVHTPKPWPSEKSAASITAAHIPEREGVFLNEKAHQDIINNDWRSHNMKINDANRRPSSNERPNLDRRESKSTENQDSNVHRLLSVLNRQEDIQNDNQLTKTSQGYIRNSKVSEGNKLNKTSTARASGKMDDLDFKLKLIDMISKQGRSDDSDNKEKDLDDAMRDLLRPDEKSDNDATLAALKAILKQSRTQKNNQGSLSSLSKLLKNMNANPQSKSDDTDIETELRQLQKAINGLRPKEDNDFNRLDLGNNRRGKDDAQDFQSMLSQIIAQNGGSSTGLVAQPILSGVGAGNNIDKNSVAATQQLVSQYLSSGNIRTKQGYVNQLPGLQNLLNSYGSPQYGTAQASPSAGMSFAYSPNSYEYGPNANIYSSLNALPTNPYGTNSNGQSSNIYTYGPISNPGALKPYTNSYTSLNPSQAVPDYSSGVYSFTSSLGPYGSNAQPIVQNPYAQPPYSSVNSYASNIPSFAFGSGSYSPSPQSPNSNYQSSSYPSGTYPSGTQPSNNYQSATASGNAGYNGVTAQSYAVGGLNKYPVAANSGYQSNSGGVSTESYAKPFFQYGSPAGGGYTGHNSGPASYVGSGMDQPYGTKQYSGQYKYDVILDLNQQILNLENIITGLYKGGYYSQTADGKATIAGLEQRIYELKAVIEGLSKPPSSAASYTSPQVTYQTNSQGYKATQPATPYAQVPYNTQQPLHADRGHTPYNTRSKPMNYAPSSNLNVPDSQKTGLYAQKSPPYSPSQSSQPSYGPANPAQSSGTTQFQAIQSNYNSNPQTSLPPSPPPQSSYQSGPQESASHNSESYQSPNNQASDNVVPYQPKESSGENVRGLKRNVEKYRMREKRQIMNSDTQSAPGADIIIGLRQASDNGPPHSGYRAGDDALAQIANVFRKYLEENLTQSETSFRPPAPGETFENQQVRSSALDGLQQKLDALKLQLESRILPGKSLLDFPGEGSSTAYGSPSSYFPKLYDGSSGYTGNNQIQKVGKNVGHDIFTKIVLIILDKVLNSLPDIIGKLFGNLVSSVGNSYGDSYSPSQNILRNLGYVGYFPLILLKLLDSLGVIMRNLKNNHLFKQFLLPAIVLGLVGGAILFVIYFFQQDEPYGYIGYQSNSYHNTYPKYEHNHDNNHFDTVTKSNNYGNDEDKSYNIQPYRSNLNLVGDGEIRENYNRWPYSNPNYRFADNNYRNPPIQYSRGYYDYFKNRFR